MKQQPWKLPVLPSEFVDSSGIVRVRPSAPDGVELPSGITVPKAFLAMTAPPAFEDQVYAYATADELISIVLDDELGDLIIG